MNSPSLELVLADRALREVPESAARQHGPTCQTLNLSENALRAPGGLAAFTALQTLILDKNGLESLEGFPRMPSLRTLWLNHNSLTDLPELADQLAASFPNLVMLSAMMNPCAPPLVLTSEEDVGKARRYRCYLAYRLPQLTFLDSAPVTMDERAEGRDKGEFLVARKPKRRTPAAADAAPAVGMQFFGGSVAAGAPPPTTGGAAVEEKKKSSAYLGLGASSYDGRHSEGNRFIVDKDL